MIDIRSFLEYISISTADILTNIFGHNTIEIEDLNETNIDENLGDESFSCVCTYKL